MFHSSGTHIVEGIRTPEEGLFKQRWGPPPPDYLTSQILGGSETHPREPLFGIESQSLTRSGSHPLLLA